ncbi:MAG: ribosome recycling factor [Pseudomonadota bacterium]|jgi:ribosome recycling factor|uniref:Ribosome-recycling factor n=1 Tax=Banduia mediterranea TaxID=3075609 RepID=A0ABU2WIA8_9GAMM|nr:ribosome recycling factor [Algiphilus sp. W345]MCH9828593.1 ribosome recycling factor [Gammaproteobacteria bacterium]MDT0497263.1 ribosome recycling factor [Algiphilus sp. W345]MEC9357071.1 ribosome recycling factor [Pseudomonadota bacterium]
MIEDIKKDAAQRMSKAIDVLNAEFAKVRTGRASSALLDHVRVDYYGAEMPVSQAATVVVEDSRTISITPWEKNMVGAIEKAIMKSDLGLTPNTAGTVIRIVMPPLTEERRRDLVKVIKTEAEQAKVAVRNVRRDANQSIKDLVKEKMIGTDEEKRGEVEIQKITDQWVAKIDELVVAKEKEMLSL